MLLNHSILFARAGFSDEKRATNLLPVPTQKGEPTKNAKQEDNANHVNRNYKDTLFRALFAEKKHLLSLYNAVNGQTIPTRMTWKSIRWIMSSI